MIPLDCPHAPSTHSGLAPSAAGWPNRGCLRWGAVLATVVFAGASAASTDTPKALFAAQINAENFAATRAGGPDAIAGIGDWALGNGVLCAGIADPDHESMLSDRGGVLVDLGHCGRGDDQWTVLQPMLNFSREEIVATESIRAEVANGEARLVTVGHLHGVRMTTIYSVGPAPSATLGIRTTLERERPGDAAYLASDVALHGNGQLTPFTLDTRGVGTSLGFEHPSVDVDDIFSGSDAIIRADLQVLLGDRALKPQIAYGWRLLDARIERADGEVEPLAHLAMNGEHFSNIAVYTDTLFWGGDGPPGLIELAHLLWLDLEVGDRITLIREIQLAKQATVAAITDGLWAEGPEVRGRIDARFATLHVFGPDDAPVTHLESEGNGEFSFRLPPGSSGPHRIEIFTRTGSQATLRVDVPQGQSEVTLPYQSVPQPGMVGFPRGEPMRLTFIGLGDTPDPEIRSDRRQFRVGGRFLPGHAESNHYALAGVRSDRHEIALAPGHYRVLASRGPLWSVSVKELEVHQGRILPLDVQPPVRLLDHPGWLSADFHVHSAPSDDSGLSVRQRIADFVAGGADLIVSTEHDMVFDYAPMIEALGLSDQIESLVGVEITSTYRGPRTPHTAGHANAFPLAVDATAYRGGAPLSQNRRLGEIAHEVHALPGRPLLQLNHPREASFDSGLGSYLSHLSVVGEPHDPTLPLTAEGNRALLEQVGDSGTRDLDFDAIELLNGNLMDRYRAARADWFAFLLQGEIRTATANSDSHTAAQIVAMPVNYVAYSAGPGEGLNVEDFMKAVRQGRLYGSTGPLLEAELEGRGPGQRYAGAQGNLRVSVRTAPWVPVDELRVFVNGELQSRHSLAKEREFSIPLEFAADSFVTLEAQGDAPPGSIYAQVAPGYTPFAFTNPIFIDANSDGQWTAPGLPSPAPITLSQPDASP